jgi:membrane-bound metal-dependent hydrolase YbcI (DUF457 family)
MPFAVTHVITSIISVDLYRDYFTKHKKRFTLFTILIAGIAGLLPDIDVPLSWLISKMGWAAGLLAHRGITHTPLFGLIFLIPGLILWYKKKHKWAILFFVTAFGILLHLALDVLVSSEIGSMLLWPLSQTYYNVHLLGSGSVTNFYASFDALILLAWLIHEEMKHKIKDFI